MINILRKRRVSTLKILLFPFFVYFQKMQKSCTAPRYATKYQARQEQTLHDRENSKLKDSLFTCILSASGICKKTVSYTRTENTVWRPCKQCFGSIFIESGSGQKFPFGSGSRKASNPDPDPNYFFTLSEETLEVIKK